MDRDIIICFGTVDYGMLIINGKSGTAIERGYELLDIIPELFDKLEYSYNKPLVKELFDEDYFSYEEVSALYKREEKIKKIFTKEELELLDEIENMAQFIDKVRENLEPYIEKVKEENEDYAD